MHCARLYTSGREETTEDKECAAMPKPALRVPCYSDCSNGRNWIYTEWSRVRKECDQNPDFCSSARNPVDPAVSAVGKHSAATTARDTSTPDTAMAFRKRRRKRNAIAFPVRDGSTATGVRYANNSAVPLNRRILSVLAIVWRRSSQSPLYVPRRIWQRSARPAVQRKREA